MASKSQGKILFIRHVSSEGPGYFEPLCRQHHWDYQILACDEEPAPFSSIQPEQFRAVISLGGPMNIYETEKYPFLKQEVDWIRRCLGRGVPFLGICLGAQLLAEAAGGKVLRASQKELGWTPVRLTEAARTDALFCDFETSTISVLQWHEDCFVLPPNAVLLAQNDICPQAFRFGCAWGLQFHTEVEEHMICDWFQKETILPGILEHFRTRRDSIFRETEFILLNLIRSQGPRSARQFEELEHS